MTRVDLEFQANRLFARCRLAGPFIPGPKVLKLLLDTGASRTVISLKDAEDLGVKAGTLPRFGEPVGGFGGRVELRELANVLLTFVGEGSALLEVPLEKAYVNYAADPRRKEERVVYGIPSVLGVDALAAAKLKLWADWERGEGHLRTG
jgi:hypothetical protein